jgi:hypothetical protein
MKSIFRSTQRSRRHRQTQPAEQQQEQQQHPFFAKAGQANVQAKPQPFFQPKLAVGKPGDPYEREADAVADAVVNQQHSGKVTPGGGAVQRMPITPVTSGSLQRAATPDEEKMPGTNDARMAEDKEIQEKPEEGKGTKAEGGGLVQKMEAPKEEEKSVQKAEEGEEPMQAKEEEEEPVQAQAEEEEVQAQAEEEEPMQAKEEEEEPVQAAAEEEEMQAKEEEEEPMQAKSEPGARSASANIGSRLSQRRGSGNPLPKSVKTNMERSFGTDFSGVRIHTDSESVEMNRDLHAQAFTNGQDIYFNAGKFNPDQTEGKRLLAHELTHVVQQGGGGEKVQRQASGRSGAARYEANETQNIPAAPSTKKSMASQAALDAKVAKLKARMKEIVFAYYHLESSYKKTILGQNLPIPQAGKLHESLAYAFLRHNPGAIIKSRDKDVVGVDITKSTWWNETDHTDFVGTGKYYEGMPQTPDNEIQKEIPISRAKNMASLLHLKGIFITGPNTVWFTNAGVEANPELYRTFLSVWDHVPESELSALMDSGYERGAKAVGNYLTIDSKEAPAPVQFIADLNPLTSIAKIIKWADTGTNLYTGKEMSTFDKFDAVFGLLGGLEGIFGKFISEIFSLSEGVQVAMKKPVQGQLSWMIAEQFKSDKHLKEIFESIIDGLLSKGIDEIKKPIESSHPKHETKTK